MQAIQALIASYQQSYPAEQDKIAAFASLVEVGTQALDRAYFTPGHLTSSCWLLNPERDAVLLTHHKKLNRWLQLGGHVDGEMDLLASSLREAREESGIDQISALSTQVIDIDIHEIPTIKGDPAHYHYDCRFLLQAEHSDYRISDESNDLRWVPINDLSDWIAEESMLRLHHKAMRWLQISD